MKKYFYIGAVLVITIAIAIVFYGAWLNYSDSKQIAKRMQEMTVSVLTEKVERRNISPTMDLDAVRFSSDNMTDIVALTDGIIQQWYVEKNRAVHKGDILCVLKNEQILLKIQQAESVVSQEEAALSRTLSMFNRQKRLLARNATSKERYEEAESNYFAAEEKLKAAKAQLAQYRIQQDWLSVITPIDGEVLIVYQSEGSNVQTGAPVALVGNFAKLKFFLNLPDKNVKNFQIGHTCFLTFNNNIATNKAYNTKYGVGNQGNKQKIRATVMEIEPNLNEPADMRRIIFEADNRAHILEPMTYTDVTMELNERKNVLVVPLSSMIDDNTIFVVDKNDVIHLRLVETGVRDDKYIEILSGLSEGDVVVIDNLEGLKDNMKIKPKM